jgi:hypothetical protein
MEEGVTAMSEEDERALLGKAPPSPPPRAPPRKGAGRRSCLRARLRAADTLARFGSQAALLAFFAISLAKRSNR